MLYKYVIFRSLWDFKQNVLILPLGYQYSNLPFFYSVCSSPFLKFRIHRTIPVGRANRQDVDIQGTYDHYYYMHIAITSYMINIYYLSNSMNLTEWIQLSLGQ